MRKKKTGRNQHDLTSYTRHSNVSHYLSVCQQGNLSTFRSLTVFVYLCLSNRSGNLCRRVTATVTAQRHATFISRRSGTKRKEKLML